jgi:drug/metabolite transporter (DMT)-like permease
MIYLLLAILSSAMIAIVMRIAQPKVSNPTALLASNYIFCTLLALVLSVPALGSSLQELPLAAGLGAVNGFIYLGGFALMQWSTRHNGVVLSSIFMKLGLLVPMVVSVVFFREMPTVIQIIGFCAAIVAIILINYRKGNGKSKARWSLILLLLAGGSCDAMSKVYEQLGSSALSAQYLFYTFVVAFLLCLAWMAKRKESCGVKDILFGLILGIPNFYSARFLLASLQSVPAVIAYPTFSVGTILVVTLAGVAFFKEKLSRRQWIALGIILLALVLLNL